MKPYCAPFFTLAVYMGLRNFFRQIKEKRKQKKNIKKQRVTFPSAPSPHQAYLPTKVSSPSPSSPPPPQPKQVGAKFSVCALYNYTTNDPDECSFVMGDILQVFNDSGTWWNAKNLRTKSEGLIPSNYITRNLDIAPVLEAWYDIDRIEAERLLLYPGVEVGTYLFRPCGGKISL